MLPRFFELIGSDRFLTPAEVQHATEPHPLLSAAWDIYRQQFGAFTGAAIDPLFHRLSHPATRCGVVGLGNGTSVVIVGTGPSLEPNLDALKRLKGRVRIFTSPRGAEALLPHGIVPDLVLVEHQTALDTHHSARHLADAVREVLPACPLIAADWRTSAALLRGVSPDVLFVPEPLPTWGLWPATAAAMAIDAGASRIALLGIDLGTATRPDPAQAPLTALLGLLARLAPIVALDCGAGAPKRGWVRVSLAEAAGEPVAGICDVHAVAAPRKAVRADQGRAALAAHAAVVDEARHLMEFAGLARSGKRVPAALLRAGAAALMDWRNDAGVRRFAQETLGLSFLPRLWRVQIDLSLGDALWRPVMLATHELVRQAEALDAATQIERAA